jgi:NAD-dependent deacetylase
VTSRRPRSESVLELHGAMNTARCQRCDHKAPMELQRVEAVPACCSCGARMRPDVVWFGETLPQEVYLAAVEASAQCDLFLTVGTSALVYPAAGLIEWAFSAGARTVEVNLEPTPASRLVNLALHGKAGEILPRLV